MAQGKKTEYEQGSFPRNGQPDLLAISRVLTPALDRPNLLGAGIGSQISQ